MDPYTAQLIASDKARLWHPFTQMKAWAAPAHEPLVLVDGEGAMVRDSEGREYIDGNSSIWTNLHGHRHPAITQAIKDQLDKVAHVSFLGSTNEPAIHLAERLVALLPDSDLTRVFYSDDGSTAVEVALKMALQYWQLTDHPQRNQFLGFTNAYHGDTAGAASLGGLGTFFDRFGAIHFDTHHVADFAALEALPEEVTSRLAAVIIEPKVQGAAGIRLWPEGMLSQLRAWCDRVGTLLIFDEVLTGFGRTGRMFACQHESVAPDFLCLAKGLTGGYLPLAATLTTERVYEAFLGEFHELKTFFYGHSYCGNALACSAALASLDIFENEHVLENLQEKILWFEELLDGLLALPQVAEIRRCGFLAGVQLQKAPGEPCDWREQTGARVCVAARKFGLLTRPILDTVALIPPLCISKDQLSSAVHALESAIKDATH